MELIIEFPLQILDSYNNNLSLAETCDEVSYFINKPFIERNINLQWKSSEWIDAIPNVHRDKYRQQISIDIFSDQFDYQWILQSLKEEGYERGLSIKEITEYGQEKVIYFEPDCADDQLRRERAELVKKK